ncbi:MAG: hypothetical protein HYZ37_11325 [Candidatus Solibacter usitatus]|nr:hypothetical protein [Candidatus Solibacter usitatus]
MHCFAFTPIKDATPAQWDAWHKATDALPSKMPFVKHVWYGKLRGPLAILGTTDAEARKKAVAGESASGPLTVTRREYGACFWFDGGADVLKQYTSHPYHKEWSAAYEKVRVAGTTTYDIIGQ